VKHHTPLWSLTTPQLAPNGQATSVVLATIHPRGDQRILKCIQSLLNQHCRVHVVWLGEEVGQTCHDDWLTETVIRTPRSTKQRLLRTLPVIRAALRDEARILYIHDFYMLPHGLLWKMLRRRGRVVFDSHEFYPELYSAKFPNLVRNQAAWAIKVLAKTLYRNVDGFSLVSPLMVSSTSRDQPIIITPNYPSRSLFQHITETDPDRNLRSIIHSGSISPAYGIATLIKAAKLLEERHVDVRIDIVNRFSSDALRDWFEQEIEANGHPSTLRRIPARPAQDMWGLLRHYGAGLSLIEERGQNGLAVPTKIYEYGVSGLFVIASDTPAQAEFVRTSPGVHGAIYKGASASSLADSIEEYLAQAEQIAQETEVARLAADIEYDWDRSCSPQFRFFKDM
jgi:glycosyltransferase involved in cell wall biosynthesis